MHAKSVLQAKARVNRLSGENLSRWPAGGRSDVLPF